MSENTQNPSQNLTPPAWIDFSAVYDEDKHEIIWDYEVDDNPHFEQTFEFKVLQFQAAFEIALADLQKFMAGVTAALTKFVEDVGSYEWGESRLKQVTEHQKQVQRDREPWRARRRVR